MLPIDEIKMTKFRPGSLGMNPKLAIDIYPVYPFTIL
jgi:hypothetical protein